MGQDEDLPDDVQPVLKPASVGVAVRVSPASLFSTLETAAGAVAAGPAGLPGLLANVLQQSDWLYNGVYHFQVQDWQQIHFHGEGTSDYTLKTVLTPNNVPGIEWGIAEHDTFSIDFDAPGEGKLITGSGTLTMAQTSSAQWGTPITSCHDQESQTYHIAVSGVESGGMLGLVLTLDGGPVPTCWHPAIGQIDAAYPPAPGLIAGSVILPDQAADPSVANYGVQAAAVTIAPTDGATETIQYTLPQTMPNYAQFFPVGIGGAYLAAQQGTFTLTLHRTNPAQ